MPRYAYDRRMSVQFVIEVDDRDGARVVLNALDAYKAHLRDSIGRTRRRLSDFEKPYGGATRDFLAQMAAEDLDGGDLEYVEWAGEASLLEGLEAELTQLEHARVQLP